MVTPRPGPTPEGQLIAEAQKKRGLSARQAAARTGISEGWWRQVVNGYQTPQRGVQIPVVARANTVAAMADTVGLSPAQLRDAGRDDAADHLAELIDARTRTTAPPPPESAPPRSPAAEGTDLTLTPEELDNPIVRVILYEVQGHPNYTLTTEDRVARAKEAHRLVASGEVHLSVEALRTPEALAVLGITTAPLREILEHAQYYYELRHGGGGGRRVS